MCGFSVQGAGRPARGLDVGVGEQTAARRAGLSPGSEASAPLVGQMLSGSGSERSTTEQLTRQKQSARFRKQEGRGQGRGRGRGTGRVESPLRVSSRDGTRAIVGTPAHGLLPLRPYWQYLHVEDPGFTMRIWGLIQSVA